MWRIPIIVNLVTLGVMSLGAAISQMRIRNNYLRYPDESRPIELLPPVSHAALHSYWLTWSVPLVWSIASVILMFYLDRKPDDRTKWTGLHTSTTMLIGALLLFFFIAGGTLPFAKLYLSLSK